MRVCCTGLCGSDLHYYNHGRNGDIVLREPLTLGHESLGVITEIGSEVKGFKIGEMIALEVGIPCGSCVRCSEGRYNICSSLRFRSSAKAFPHFQGTLQTRLNHPAAWCHNIPSTITMDQAALLEPLGVAIHAVRRARLEGQSTTLVLGAGAIGLLTAGMLHARPNSRVVIADLDKGRVDFAVENGFAHAGIIVPRRRSTTIDERLRIARELASNLMGVDGLEAQGGFDAVFECTGAEASLQASIYVSVPCSVGE